MSNGDRDDLLRMEDIQKWYGAVRALDGIDFRVDAGEIVGLIGDNGAGKSTLIEILAGVQSQSSGDIYWNGDPVEIRSVEEARELNIETVFQDQAVIENRSVAENIFLGRELTRSIGPLELLDMDRMREEAAELTEELDLTIATPDQEVRFCSGGEKQGVAIARALYFDAELIILDEPTTALAVSGVQTVLNFIEQLRESGTACVFITHNLRHVYSVADRFVVLSNGEKVADLEKEATNVDELESLQTGVA